MPVVCLEDMSKGSQAMGCVISVQVGTLAGETAEKDLCSGWVQSVAGGK